MKKFLYTLLCLFTAAALNSCGNDDDNPLSDSTSGEVFANVESYPPDYVTFALYLPGLADPSTFVCDRSPIITEEEFPKGTRVFIAYTIKGMQQLIGWPVRIALDNICKATTTNLIAAKSDQCKLDYAPISLESPTYVSGNYINFVANVQQAASRTWKVLLNTETSTGDVAHVYILTEAVDAKPQRINEPVSVVLSTFKPQYKYIFLHFKTETNDDYTLSLEVTSPQPYQ